MTNKTLSLLALAIAGLALPLSNMLGFSGENKPIPVASGATIEGNVGSSIKMDYTVLGDSVDQAIYLSMFARDANKIVAIDESIKIIAAESWGFKHLGEFTLKELTQVYGLTNVEQAITPSISGASS